MKRRHLIWGVTLSLVSIFLMGASMDVNASLFGVGDTNWKEEALQHDGSTVIVERSQSRGGRHEIGQGPPVKEQSIRFTLPGTNKTFTWKDEFSQDVGSANFNVLALHVLNGVPYVVVSAYGCLAYNKWGRPNPPYVIFRFDVKAWQRIPLHELPSELTNINLVIDSSNNEEKLRSIGLVSAEPVKEFNKWYRQPEYRTILREPLPKERINQMCEERVLYKGSWILPDDPIARKFIDQRQR